MKQVEFGSTGEKVPTVAVGCMRMGDLTVRQAAEYIERALALGVNFFDHADIYGGGRCEEIFAEAFMQTGHKREEIFLQSKCGIVPGKMYDLSKDYIVGAVDGILRRLHTDYLDALLLHRPDALVEPEEVAAAFDELEASGKVRHFGVSNHSPAQIELLKTCVKQPLAANQLQFGLAHAGMVRSGLEVNMDTDGALLRDGAVLDYCRLHQITIQTWSPFQYGMFEGVFLGSDKFPELNRKIDELALCYGVTNTAIAVAWITRHPARMQVLAGTMNPSRLAEICTGAELALTREEWYALYMAAGNRLP